MPFRLVDFTAGPQFLRFAREHGLKLLAISCLVLVPCFWHREIVASDLGSHLYNAWLVQLIHRGRLPGLWIASQHTNVLFDILLSAFGSVFGLLAAEKIAVSLAVLIFFWGLFALVSAATHRAPWFLLPCLALFTYGWTFHLGFFNYYLSLGLSFFSLAIFWRVKGWQRLAAVAIAPLVLVAHPLGFAWLLGAAAYIGIAEMAPGWRKQLMLFVLAAASLVAVRLYLLRHYQISVGARPFFVFNGADQLFLFGARYYLPSVALIVFAVFSLTWDVVRRRDEPGFWARFALPLQLYFLAELAVLLLPGAIYFPPPAAPAALLTERLTSVSAGLGCCLLGVMRPSKWHLAGSAAIAAVFFSFLFHDTATVNRMEAQVESLVSKLPANQRVMATIFPPPGSRVLIQHIVDRACIGRCFSYGNYEPGSALFRVRALPGNHFVLSEYALAVEMEEGGYKVQPEDLPVYQVYQCSLRGTDLCIRPLNPGEENDRLGVHPDD
ncbi:MAG TPA: hypothetical protein VJO53_04030 [Candidatus Acidoferrales bacterium]|nr:hypothetical protein [Candidatus Acidoferrales bacterium]